MNTFKHSDLVFEMIKDGVVHIKAKDHKILAQAFVRFQEHYESQIPEIKGKIFTLGQLRAAGTVKGRKGVFTYTGGNHFDTDWSGYNFPSYVLDPFIKGLFDPLTSYEKDIVDALRCKEGRFYVIGTFGENDQSEALRHELCHAKFYLNKDYKKDCLKLINENRKCFSKLTKKLNSFGYCDDVIDDEIQAYLVADWDYVKSYGIDLSDKIKKSFEKIDRKYKDD